MLSTVPAAGRAPLGLERGCQHQEQKRASGPFISLSWVFLKTQSLMGTDLIFASESSWLCRVCAPNTLLWDTG